jgi:type I restriction and modification enzyme subunit R-like protein
VENYIDPDIQGSVRTDSEVEQKIAYPLLIGKGYLAIAPEMVKSKEYLGSTTPERATGEGSSGYIPDFSVWMHGIPVLIVEVKDPAVGADVGFREACLYARHLNVRYPKTLNPCRFVIATNGSELLAGYWDERPYLHLSVSELQLGSSATERLNAFCNAVVLEEHSRGYLRRMRIGRGIRPFHHAGGQAVLNAKRPLNTFAADLSPILLRYFSSTSEAANLEIAARAYVSSEETTEYDRILEAMLKERVSPRRDTLVQPLQITKHGEPILTKAIQTFGEGDRQAGQLQLIQGAVGSGKSLFARRYHDLLEPPELRENNLWSFIDFNSSPPSLKGAEDWLCRAFITGFERENPTFDLDSEDALRRLFSRLIQRRRGTYEIRRKISEEEELRARATDLETWHEDPRLVTEGLAQFLVSTGKTLVVVLDNVDKMEIQNQLDAFQLALWFLALTSVATNARKAIGDRYR